MTDSKHMLLATIGSFGDLHPMIALGLELRQRGHRITLATMEIYRQKIEGLGLEFHPIRPDLRPEDPEFMRRIMDLKKGPEVLIRELIMPSVRDMHADLSEPVSQADCIIAGELVFAAGMLADQHRIPWAMAVLQPSSFFSVHDPSVLAPLPFTKFLHSAPTIFHRLLIGAGKLVIRSWTKPLADLRRDLGLPKLSRPLFEDKYSPHLNLALFSKVVGEPQPDWPAKTVQAGFVFYDRLDHHTTISPALQTFLDACQPPIVFTLGTAAVYSAGAFYSESAQAASRLNRRAVLLMGNNPPDPNWPPEVAAFDYAPFSEIFPRAACVVHQGGAGTTAQALRAGIPQLIVPYGFDQPDHAARMERLGVARSIGRHSYSAESATAALRHLLDNPRYALRAKVVAKEVQAEDGLKDSCDAIERLSRLRPSSRP